MTTKTKLIIAFVAYTVVILAAALVHGHLRYKKGAADMYTPAFINGLKAGFESGLERGRECADGCEGKQTIYFPAP